jgi:hypothetical protein
LYGNFVAKLFGYPPCFDDLTILSQFHRSFAFLFERVSFLTDAAIVASLAARLYTKSGDFANKKELSSIAPNEFHLHLLWPS